MLPNITKLCKKCEQNKSIESFGNDKSRKDGKYLYCKDCANAAGRVSKKKNLTRCASYNKEYRAKNREKWNEHERRYYKENSERLGENAKRWRETPSGAFRFLHLSASRRAKKKCIPYELDDKVLQFIAVLQGNNCALTGIPFELESDGEYRVRPFALSLDRKDNSKGYTYDNVQIVCVIANKAKNEYPQELFDRMCLARAEKLRG